MLDKHILEVIDNCDTAFTVLNLSDDLSPQARNSLKTAWAGVQEILMKYKYPNGAYKDAILSTPDSAFNLMKDKNA